MPYLNDKGIVIGDPDPSGVQLEDGGCLHSSETSSEESPGLPANALVDRNGQGIVDRTGQQIVART